MPVRQRDENDAQRNNYYCRQYSRARHIYQVAIDIMAKGMRNEESVI
jgi:hypothetical protein